MMPPIVRLYHYTARRDSHLGSIIREGILRTTESNVSIRRAHAGPDVVWLTNDPTFTPTSVLRPDSPLGFAGLPPEKAGVRITVEISKRVAQPWRGWAAARGCHPKTMTALARVGGSGRWFVVERVIPRSEWVEVINTETGELIPFADPSLSGEQP